MLDIVRGRTAKAPVRWLLRRPHRWLEQIRWAVLDLSGPYRAAFDTALPHARQVADPFHVVRLANDALDEVRRRVQNQTLGHRGHKHDPLYRARKLLVSASERITDQGRTKLRGLLDAGDPYGEVRDAWHARETLRSIYDIDDAKVGTATVNQLSQDLQDPAMPPEINRLGRTIWRWRAQISAWHAARVTNAPTEAAILWSVSEGVVDVADGHVAGSGGRVLWIVSLESAMLLAAWDRQRFLRPALAGRDAVEVACEGSACGDAGDRRRVLDGRRRRMGSGGAGGALPGAPGRHRAFTEHGEGLRARSAALV